MVDRLQTMGQIWPTICVYVTHKFRMASQHFKAIFPPIKIKNTKNIERVIVLCEKQKS